MKGIKENMRDKIISLIFLVFVVVMGIGTAIETKKVYVMPQDKDVLGIMLDYCNTFEQNAAWKDTLSKWNSMISMKLTGDRYLQSSQVLMGKNGWLFYKTQGDGRPIEDYRGTNHYYEVELEEIANNLVRQRDYLASQGIRMVIEFNPNKETIYAEHMPDSVYRITAVSKEDLLVEYLRSHTDLEIVYTKDELMQAKEQMQVYYKYDTHWNLAGAYIGVQNLLRQLNGTYHCLEDVSFDITENREYYIRDLARISNMDDYFPADQFYSIRPESYDHGQWVDANILMVGDSFSEYIKVIMQDNYCPKIDYVSALEFTPDMLAQYQPQIVVVECVERYTDRLKTLNFIP